LCTLGAGNSYKAGKAGWPGRGKTCGTC